jgi:TetR/AcrR family transcriptional repressor of nem operon
VGERLRATTQSLESAPFDVLTEARLRGDIPAGRSPEDLAALLVTTLQGLPVRGAVDPDRSTLMRSAEVALACLG